MIFSNRAIKQALECGSLKISPLNLDSIDNAHVDLHLEVVGDNEALVIPPKAFIIANTIETITTDSTICAFMEGRASLAKLGISIEQSSTFIEPKTNNKMVLEIFNASNTEVVLKKGQPIAKMFVMRVVEEF